MKRHNKVMMWVSFLLVSALLAGCSHKGGTQQVDRLTENNERTESIIHESADVLYYESGYPYIHDVLTNNTDHTIAETEYCMLAYDADGLPLQLYWDFLDSSAECSYDHVTREDNVNLVPRQTEDYRGGWSLYDGDVMTYLPKAGNGGPNQVAYALVCLKEVVFKNGSVWSNPEYDDFLQTYSGKQIDVDTLQNYYPHTYEVEIEN
ncbi:MAG: hypothetical protein HDR71_11720 [Lachnospiraceae bacterium]|nr:hypothetical protein [Lachnospiraceae bacterium]